MVSIFDRLIQKLKRRKARYGERGYEPKPFKMDRVDTWDYYDDVEKRITVIVNTIVYDDDEVYDTEDSESRIVTDVYISPIGCDLKNESIHDYMEQLDVSSCDCKGECYDVEKGLTGN